MKTLSRVQKGLCLTVIFRLHLFLLLSYNLHTLNSFTVLVLIVKPKENKQKRKANVFAPNNVYLSNVCNQRNV